MTEYKVLARVDSAQTGVTVILNTGETLNVHPTHERFKELVQLLSEDKVADFVAVLNPATRIKNYLVKSSDGRIKLEDGVLTDNQGLEIPAFLINHVLWMAERDVKSVQPILNLIERLQLNPSRQARMEFGEWFIKAKMPITEDGFILAYKRVNGDYTSVHDGKFDNTPNTTEPKKMPGGRGAVDDNRDRTCSYGLHFCSLDYLSHFSGERVVLLKVDPQHVVSIPSDYDHTKGRACEYFVIADITDQFEKNGNKLDKAPTIMDTPVVYTDDARAEGYIFYGYGIHDYLPEDEDDEEDAETDEELEERAEQAAQQAYDDVINGRS